MLQQLCYTFVVDILKYKKRTQKILHFNTTLIVEHLHPTQYIAQIRKYICKGKETRSKTETLIRVTVHQRILLVTNYWLYFSEAYLKGTGIGGGS